MPRTRWYSGDDDGNCVFSPLNPLLNRAAHPPKIYRDRKWEGNTSICEKKSVRYIHEENREEGGHIYEGEYNEEEWKGGYGARGENTTMKRRRGRCGASGDKLWRGGGTMEDEEGAGEDVLLE